mmetsp:Transcript_3362/g.4949  ORF Transcript_3362/g.4949 Transcript_3362/m.4949 type:complete len:226 (+) Transcript_3362:91-768(+)
MMSTNREKEPLYPTNAKGSTKLVFGGGHHEIVVGQNIQSIVMIGVGAGGSGGGGWHVNNCNKTAGGGGASGGVSKLELGSVTVGTRYDLFVGQSSVLKDGEDTYVVCDQNEILRAGGGQAGHPYDAPEPFIASGGSGNFTKGNDGSLGMTYQAYMQHNATNAQSSYLGEVGKGADTPHQLGKGGLGGWNRSGEQGEKFGSGGGGGTSTDGSLGGCGCLIVYLMTK